MDQKQKEKINDLFLCYLEQKRERGEMQQIYYGQLMTQVPSEPELLETWMQIVTHYAPRFTIDEVSLIERVLKYDYKGLHKCIDTYDSMLKALVVAGEAFIPRIFSHLFSLIAPLPEEDQEPGPSINPSLTSLDFQELTPEWIAEHCTHIIIEIARNYPSYTPHLIKPLKKFFPHKSFSEQAHQLYVESILLISEAFEGVRDTIIALVVNKMLAVDIDIQLDLGEEDDEETSMFDVEMETPPQNKHSTFQDKAKHTQVLLASNLDTMMYQILQYIDRICKRSHQEREKVFNLLLRIFEKSILHSIKCKFTQYLLFYICKYDYSTQFLSYLMNTAFDSLKPPITRQLCFAYASSFCSRSNYTPIPQTLYCLNLISQWCCAYIKNQTGQIVVSDSDDAFFAAVQAILYTLCFRMEPMVEFLRSTSGDPSVSSLTVINSLELRFILSSSYNPSQGCNQSVVREFCKFMSDQHIDEIADLINQQLQSRDSYSVLRRQKQNHTEMQLNPGAHRNDRQSAHEYQALLSSTNVNSFFPFDPFLLKHSSAFIDPLYIKWNRSFSFGEEAFEDSGTEDADDHFSSSFECDSDLSSSYGDGMMSFTPEFSYNFGLELAKRRQ